MEHTDQAVEKTNQAVSFFQDLAITYGPRIAYALLVLLVGWKLVGMVMHLVEKRLQKSKVDETLEHFLTSLIGILLKALLLISVASMLGVETTSFVAVLGAAGLAVGLALQGSLSNFAGGVLILMFKPFKSGDFIEAQGETGIVKEIHIFTTMIDTLDNKRVIIPNGPLANGNITNYTTHNTRRVDISCGISYSTDIDRARAVIQAVMEADERVLKSPAPAAKISAMADSSVKFTVRPWAKTEDYWDVYFDITEAIKKAFDANDITIPFPQRDVHLYQAS